MILCLSLFQLLGFYDIRKRNNYRHPIDCWISTTILRMTTTGNPSKMAKHGNNQQAASYYLLLAPSSNLPSYQQAHSMLRHHPSIDCDDLVRHIPRLNHPHHRPRNLIRLTKSSDRNFYSRQYKLLQCLQAAILFANSSGLPGNIFVSATNAGATPFTVTPFPAQAPASQ
jgi:hypothetical protein